MRLFLLAYPYRISKDLSGRRYRNGAAFWRVAIYGVHIAEPCECDNVQGCMVAREKWHVGGEEGFYPYEGIDEDTGEHYVYGPAADCSCNVRPPHRHWGAGMMIDRPIRRT